MLVRPPALRWKHPTGFLLAAIGAAFGLDALATVPQLALHHGGGAFLLAYLVVVGVATIPVLILEIGVGVCFQSSAPGGLRRLNRRLEWVGWWTTALAAISAILVSAHGVSGIVLAGHASLAVVGDAAMSWETPHISHVSLWSTPHPDAAAGVLPSGDVVIAALVLWALIARVLHGGLPAIGRWCTMLIPLILALLVGIGVGFLYQPGAVDGVARYLVPQWSALGELETWSAAVRAAFLTQALGLGVYIAYASHLERGADSAGHALVIGMAGAGFTFLAGFVGCAAYGMIGYATGVPAMQVAEGGGRQTLTILIAAVELLPLPTWGAAIMAMLLAGLWTLLAMTSLMGLCAALAVAWTDAFAISWERAVRRLVPALFCLALIPLLPSLSSQVETLGRDLFPGAVAFAVAAQCFALVSIGSGGNLERHINAYSAVRVGAPWRLAVIVGVPALLAGTGIKHLLSPSTQLLGEASLLGMTALAMASTLILFSGRRRRML